MANPADRLNTQHIALLKEQFDFFDKDGDGKLTKEDTAAIMRSLGQNPSEEEITAKHNEFDTDGDGFVEFPEFMNAMAKNVFAKNIHDEEIAHIFLMLDQDGDGFLNRSELSQGLATDGTELSVEEVDEMLAEYDKDGDGKLGMEEFARMMKDEIYETGLAPN